MTRLEALGPAVGTMMPGTVDTLLLRACIDEGAAGRAALDAWLARTPDPAAALTHGPCKWLMPLLDRACIAHGVDAGPRLATLLRAASFREALRTRSLRGILAGVLEALRQAGIVPVVLKGSALADVVYADPALRHVHDVELLLPADQRRGAVAVLARRGFAPTGPVDDGPCAMLVHVSGLPLVLHRQPFRVPFYNLPGTGEAMRARAQPARVAGVEALVPSPEDALVHVCGQGMHLPGRSSYRWLVDAAFLVKRRTDLDPACVARIASACRLTLPVAAALRFLDERLGLAAAAAFHAALAAQAPGVCRLGGDLALHAACDAAGGLLPLLARLPSTDDRIAALRARLAPSLAFLAWSTQPARAWPRAVHARAFGVVGSVARRVASAAPRGTRTAR